MGGHPRRNPAAAHRARLLIAAAATVASVACDFASASTVNGTVVGGEYTTTLATQTTPTGFGDNFSELNQALSNYTPGGNLELALTGNLEPTGNAIVLFIDSKPGGGVANTAANVFNQFGSISGAHTQTWGTDTNPGAGVTTPPGGASIISPGFNPDYAVEIHNTGGAAYFINVIDLTLPNTPANNRDIFVGSAPLNSGAAVTQTYTRLDANNLPIDSGDITSSFNNTNTAGVTDTSAANAATATKGLELIFENQFLAQAPGHALRILPFITSPDGQFLSNQFLPGLGAGVANPGAANNPIGTALFDARNFSDRLYLDVFTPTLTASGGAWTTGASWSGGTAPNGVEHAARLGGSIAQTVNLTAPVTLGFLDFTNPAGTTITGAGPINFNSGNAVAATFVTAGDHTISGVVNVQSDWRVSIATGTSLSTGGLSSASNRTITKVNPGTLTLGGAMANAAGLKLDVQRGTVAINGDLGSGLAAATTAPDVVVGVSGGGSAALANFGATQTLRNLTINADGVANVLPSGSRAVVANTIALNGNGKLDLGDNNMVIKSMPAGSASGGIYSGVQGHVQRAYHLGAWDQAGLATTRSDAISGLTTLGVATGAQVRGLGPTDTDIWNGLSISGGDTLVMYTYTGDANLDGVIDGGDYGMIDNFVQVPGADGYGNGDFNYDGVIDGGDYGIIDNNIQSQGAPLGDSAPVGAGISVVPEPSACGFAILAVVLAMPRRNRRHRRDSHLC